MKDRNEGYVPDPTYDGGDIRPHYTTLVGNPFSEHVDPRVMPVAIGAADELNRTDTWEWAQVSDGTEDRPEHWTRFEGHAIRVTVDMRSWNEREVNDWKGRDEVRKTGEYLIAFNEQVVYGDGFSDPLETLLTIRSKIQKLMALPFDWRCPGAEYEALIVGRRIFYRDKPAVVESWFPDQGCVWIKPLDPREQLDDYYEDTGIKDVILSPHIWWWRDENQMERDRS